MKLPAAVLGLSLAVNVVLAAFVFNPRPSSSSSESSPPTSLASGGKTATTAAQPSTDAESPVGETSPGSATAGFHWAQLESADYKEYIARLRAFGVPERVVRDIIIADVNKLYRPRFAALRPPQKPQNVNFWETRNRGFNPDRAMTKEQREQTAALRKEQSNLIKELLGADVYETMARESGVPDWTERTYGLLSKEARDQIADMQQRFQEAQSEIYAKADGYIDQDTQAELAAARKKLRAELATVLTPEQLEEYELRSSETAQQMRWELSWFEPDEKEFRAIHATKQAQADINALLNPEVENTEATREQIKALQERQKELNQALTDALGPNRAREYQLAEQWEYRSLLEGGISKDIVLQIPDIKSEAEQAAAKLRNDKTLSREQRTAALQELKQETLSALSGMLGERRARAYQAQGGYWLRNLAPQN